MIKPSTFAALSKLGKLAQTLVGRWIFQIVQALFLSPTIPNGMYIKKKQTQIQEIL